MLLNLFMMKFLANHVTRKTCRYCLKRIGVTFRLYLNRILYYCIYISTIDDIHERLFCNVLTIQTLHDILLRVMLISCILCTQSVQNRFFLFLNKKIKKNIEN